MSAPTVIPGEPGGGYPESGDIHNLHIEPDAHNRRGQDFVDSPIASSPAVPKRYQGIPPNSAGYPAYRDQNGAPSDASPVDARSAVRNYSTPTRQYNPSIPPDKPPPDYTFDPSQLSFDALHLNDPIPRSGSSMSLRPPVRGFANQDPIPRSRSTAPDAIRGHPRHANTLPSPDQTNNYHSPHEQQHYPPQQPYNGYGPGPSYDAQSMRSTRNSGYEENHVAYEDNQVRGPDVYVPNGYYPPTHMQYGRPMPPPGQGYNPPPPPVEYNPLYAAASDLLGAPPGAPPPQPAYQQGYAPRPGPPPGPYPSQRPPPPSSYSLADAQSMHSGMSSAPSFVSSAASISSGGSSLQRADTMMSSMPSGRQTTKAVDVNAPPYTKEYVDQYRARLKGDPDPETHFAFAKYLIEAAKKIGANAADQRAVRKYRDQLLTESLKVIRRLATSGETYPEAQFFLANCYGTGMLGLETDHERAYHLYLQASKANHAQSCYRVAMCNEIGAGTKRDHSRAFAFYRKAASLGDTAAMYKLGMILLRGALGQPKNPRDAVTWLRRAAEQADEENPHALHELGLLHESPQNTTGVIMQDEAYAKELFTQAAHLGYTQSQFKLGYCYEYGTLGCPLDPKRSIAWYTRAAEKGDSEAELALSGWYLTGSEGVLIHSDNEAYLWARKAAQKGLAKAEYAVGYYTEMGIGVKQDIEVAKRWYMRAAGQGNTRAMNRLTELKRDGNKARRGRPTRQQAKDEGCIIA